MAQAGIILMLRQAHRERLAPVTAAKTGRGGQVARAPGGVKAPAYGQDTQAGTIWPLQVTLPLEHPSVAWIGMPPQVPALP